MDKRQIRIKELDNKIRELERKQSPFIKERNKLKDQINLEENKVLLGKCFKYRNSYGSGEKWWLYRKVVSVGDWDVTVISAQDCNNGTIEIIKETHSASGYKIGGYHTEISLEEFNKNFEDILKKIKR